VDEENLYDELARDRPNAVKLGGALITLVEPHAGFERAYNRWYEDDHFYAGAMVGPWGFAGGRWVATRDLQLMRSPSRSSICDPVTLGCYLSAFWVTAGHLEDYERWAATAMRDVLYPEGRGFAHRDHIYSGFHTLSFSATESDPLRAEHALDRHFASVVLEAIDRSDDWTAPQLLEWLQVEHVPEWMERTGAAVCVGFTPRPLPAGSMPFARAISGLDQRLTLMWFLKEDPRVRWAQAWSRHSDALKSVGAGTLTLCAPFVPTLPGTDRYADELR
jgi:hypothetical protein